MSLVDQAIESEALDWYRYTWFCYVIWTRSDCETVCRKVLRVPGLQDSYVLVNALDPEDGFGQLPQTMWEWLKRDRGFGTLQIWTPPDVDRPYWPGLPAPPQE
jgi:hypothetical protein